MATDWGGEFKKLYEDVSDSWIELPIVVRGIGCELLRAADRRTGKVADSTKPSVLCRKLGADVSEADTIARAVDALVKQGFMSVTDSGELIVTNLRAAQAEQRERWKAQKGKQRQASSMSTTVRVDTADVHHVRDVHVDAADVHHVHPCPPVSTPVHPCPQMSSREERRREEKRPTSSDRAGEPRRVDDDGHETLCPPDLADRASESGVIAELAAQLRVSPDWARSVADEFVAFWVIGGGAGKRKTTWMRHLRQRITAAARGTVPSNLPLENAKKPAEKPVVSTSQLLQELDA